jgi:hypothetical protein
MYIIFAGMSKQCNSTLVYTVYTAHVGNNTTPQCFEFMTNFPTVLWIRNRIRIKVIGCIQIRIPIRIEVMWFHKTQLSHVYLAEN